MSALPASPRPIVGLRQVGLEITDDRAEKARREKPGPEGAGGILTDGRQLAQGGSGRRGDMAKLPADLLSDRLRLVRGGQSSRLSGVRGSTECVRAHVRDARGLPGRSGGGYRGRSAHLTSGCVSDESPPGLRDAKLAAGKRPKPVDGIARAAIPRSFHLEQSDHPLRAVRRPRGDDPPVGFAQRLRRPHAQILARVFGGLGGWSMRSHSPYDGAAVISVPSVESTYHGAPKPVEP